MSRVEEGAAGGVDHQKKKKKKMDEVFFWENKSWSVSNSENSSEISKEKSRSRPMGESGSDGKELMEIKPENEVAQPADHPDRKRKRGAAGSCMMQGNSKGSKAAAGSSSGGSDEKGGGGGKAAAAGDQQSDHEVHIWTERERRKKMRNMFSCLHDLLPQLPPKTDKSTIVDEAIKQIKKMEETVEKLEKQKLERLQSSSSAYDHHSSNIVASISLPHDHYSRQSFMADHVYSNNNTNTNTNTNTSSSNLSLINSSSSRHPLGFKTWTSANLVMNVCGEEAHFSVCSVKMPGLWTSILYVLHKHRMEVVSAHLDGDCNRCIGLIHARVKQLGGATDPYSQPFPSVEMFKDAAAEINLMLC